VHTSEVTVDLLEPLTSSGAAGAGDPRTRWQPTSSLAVGAGVSILLGTATVWVLLRVAGPDAVPQVLGGIDGRLLVAVIGLQVLSSATLAQIYRATHAANGGTLRYRDALTAALGAFSLTQLLPAGGAVGGLFAMHRLRAHGADAVHATTTVLLTGLVMLGTLGLAISVATTVTALWSPSYRAYALASATVTALLVTALVLVRAMTVEGPVRRRLAAALGHVRWRGRSVGTGWADALVQHGGSLRRPTVLLRPAGWSALKWSFDAAVLGLLLHAFGAGAPFLAILVAFAVGHLLNGLPLTPGGIGVVEAGLAGTLLAFGADPAATSLAVIGYRAIAFWFPVLVAAPLVLTGIRPAPARRAAVAL
jgi:putative heme transporter